MRKLVRRAQALLRRTEIRASPDSRPTPAGRLAPNAGLSLVEVLVVLAIIAMVASVAAPQVLRYVSGAKTETARTQINHLAAGVELYFLDIGAYPPQEPGLKALLEAPADKAGRWKGPYLKKETGFVDPWGRPYAYRHPGQRGDFEVFTLGRDGQPGGTGEDADLGSWK